MFTGVFRIGLFGLMALAITGFAPSVAAQSTDLDLTQHTDVGSAASLPRIFRGLRQALKDPQSISDFTLCPGPRKVKIKDGRPLHWTWLFSLNSRNAMGGYTGLQPYAAVLYADGRISIDSLTMTGADGFSKLGNDLIRRDMADCPYLSKDELRKLIEDNL